MSIYGSLWAPDDAEHAEDCAVYTEVEPGVFEFSGQPCDCGQPDAPLAYQGSHVLPHPNNPRGGTVDIACIPDHITRDDHPYGAEGQPKPFLRLGVSGGIASEPNTVVLTREHVARIHRELSDWLREYPE